ncbi:RrF2 family transcriptional regulator [Nannocystis bainbridge]|uniref:Rrf2 family transcriptional regulator n=1 Tax=Nannocystis bainbridge TaxID=2995303 RepID=A0ABT5DQ40_9BACT|nr:Rrf2 family transcriptional regulator [Nannocystis bainbridge]MDC0715718.1 Rrf2 family transcriptional regulator [Nannocystis bainbridge]
MQLTQFTDYALRTLLYLAVHRDRLVPVAEISAAYGISNHHLVKVAHQLARLGHVESARGRGGGLRLARDPADVTVGEVVRATEPHFHVVECFDADHNACPIVPACGLMRTLAQARERFLEVLDSQRLADLVQDPVRVDKLVTIWKRTGSATRRQLASPE